MAFDIGHLLLALLFALTVAHLVTLKLCSNTLDHRTAPIFISGWTLAGLAVTAPLFWPQMAPGIEAVTAAPWIAGLIVLKAGLMYAMLVASQGLMKVSLSTRHYVTPLAIGLLAFLNSMLGEELTTAEWIAALGLCALAATFLIFGHAAELTRRARLVYAGLVLLVVATGVIDQAVLKHLTWYPFLLGVNLVILALALTLGVGSRNWPLLRAAALHPMAITAGVVYAATELLKFYQMVEINKVTVIVIVQAMTKPVILILSAVIWKERTVREQLIWGVLAMSIVIPMFLK